VDLESGSTGSVLRVDRLHLPNNVPLARKDGFILCTTSTGLYHTQRGEPENRQVVDQNDGQTSRHTDWSVVSNEMTVPSG
jgi:hypothetical protein